MPLFLCFDMQNRRAEDADVVDAQNPAHACQEYVAALEQGSMEISRTPYIIAVRFEQGDPNRWDMYKVQPVVTVEYKIEQPDHDDLSRNHAQSKPVTRPVVVRPPNTAPPQGTILRPFPTDRRGEMPGDPSLYPE